MTCAVKKETRTLNHPSHEKASILYTGKAVATRNGRWLCDRSVNNCLVFVTLV